MSPQIFLEVNQEHLDKNTYSSRLKFKDHKGRKAGEGTFYSTPVPTPRKNSYSLLLGRNAGRKSVTLKMSKSSPQMYTTHAGACALLTDDYDEMKRISSH